MAPLLRNHWHGHSEIANSKELTDEVFANTKQKLFEIAKDNEKVNWILNDDAIRWIGTPHQNPSFREFIEKGNEDSLIHVLKQIYLNDQELYEKELYPICQIKFGYLRLNRLTLEDQLDGFKNSTFGEAIIEQIERSYDFSSVLQSIKSNMPMKDIFMCNGFDLRKFTGERLKNICFTNKSVMLQMTINLYVEFFVANQIEPDDEDLFNVYMLLVVFNSWNVMDYPTLLKEIQSFYKKGFLSKSEYQKSKISYRWSLYIYEGYEPIYRWDSFKCPRYFGYLESRFKEKGNPKFPFSLVLVNNFTNNYSFIFQLIFNHEEYPEILTPFFLNLDENYTDNTPTLDKFVNLKTGESILIKDRPEDLRADLMKFVERMKQGPNREEEVKKMNLRDVLDSIFLDNR